MKIISLLAALMISAATQAGSATSGTLSTVHFMSGGNVILYTSGSRSDVPSCASTQPNRFAVNGTTEGGKVQLSGLLTAYAAGKSVVIYGTGTCSVQGDTETISYFYTND